jgi:hypothetical protein
VIESFGISLTTLEDVFIQIVDSFEPVEEIEENFGELNA